MINLHFSIMLTFLGMLFFNLILHTTRKDIILAIYYNGTTYTKLAILEIEKGSNFFKHFTMSVVVVVYNYKKRKKSITYNC